MKSKYYFLLTIVVIGLASIVILFPQAIINNGKSGDTLPSSTEPRADFYSISQIKRGNLLPGDYQSEGYVVKIYTCPACPPPKQCKPCMGNNLVISETNQLIDNYNLTNQQLIIFTDNVEIFKLGKKYRFTLQLTDQKTTLEPINDLNLIDYQLVK